MTSLPLSSLPPERLSAFIKKAETTLTLRRARNRIKGYRPYPKQALFHAAGREHRERLFMAANQVGKTWAGASETALHLCGRYPDWWDGRVFAKPVRAWAAGETGVATRDSVQKLLIGPPQQADMHGTGAIPFDAILDKQPARGVPDLLDSIVVRHGGGGDVQAGESILIFKSYEQGREKFQADTLDFLWFDEEPDEGTYTEGLTRTNATDGIAFMTFTPVKGASKVVLRFIMPAPEDAAAKDRHVTQMTIEEAEHFTPEKRAQIVASYPDHEREARTLGKPSMGSGMIFPVAEEDIACDAFAIPKHWARLGAMDFGWDHPFAAVELAWDRDEADVIYVTKTHRMSKAAPVLHAAALKPWGATLAGVQWLPWAWPRDGRRETLEGAGIALAKQYEEQGLAMLHTHAQFEDGSVSVEAGLMEMLTRMNTGRFKVFKHLNDWFEEFRLYHRKDGRVVKERDDLMSASRYGVMMRRFAEPEPAPAKETESRGHSWARF